MAPRVGLEPTTNSLHCFPSFLGRGLYHHPLLESEDAKRFDRFLGLLPLGIVSGPFLRFLSGLGC